VKRLLRWLLVLVVVVGGAAVAFSRFPNGWSRPATDNYRQVSVTRGDITAVVNSTGTVQPVLSVQVGAIVSGPIKLTNVDFNARVKKDDILAEIDPRTFEAQVKRDEASLAHRQADRERVAALLEQAKNNERRATNLRKTKSSYISETELDQVTAERKALEAQLKLADAQVQEATAALSLSKANETFRIVRSPVDGIVIERKVDPGQTVAASFQTPVMFVIAPELDVRVFVHASVDEADIGMIRSAKDREQPVSFTVDAYPDDLFEGKIHQVRLNSTTVQNVVTYTVVVEAPNRELKLLPGMTATLSFHIDTHANVLRIPNEALRFYPLPDQVHDEFKPLLEGQLIEREKTPTGFDQRSAKEKIKASRSRSKRHVWFVDGEKLAAVEVTTGISDHEQTELVSGNLKDGQMLVSGIRPPEFQQ
jgi:HlyD family secretion protein